MSKQVIWLIGAISFLTLGSCSKHNRPDEPAPKQFVNENLSATHTVAQLKALYQGQATLVNDDVLVEATIISDDTEGNLYRTAFIQDATGGIELKLSLGNLSTIYPQGSKIMLKAKGMTLGRYGGQINIGYTSTNERYETSYYPELLVPKVLIYLGKGAVTPREVTIASIKPSMQGELVRLREVQFQESELGSTYASPEHKDKQANVNHTLIDKSGKTIIVRTSSYAKFAGRQLPQGSGDFVGILTFFNRTPQLLLLREQDAQLKHPRF